MNRKRINHKQNRNSISILFFFMSTTHNYDTQGLFEEKNRKTKMSFVGDGKGKCSFECL